MKTFLFWAIFLVVGSAPSISIAAKMAPAAQQSTDLIAKRRRAELLADTIIKRWHETLDVKFLFAEYQVNDPQVRKLTTDVFSEYYSFTFGKGGLLKPDSTVDEELMREGLFAFLNALCLQGEMALATVAGSDSDFEEPIVIQEKLKEADRIMQCEHSLSRGCLIAYISFANEISDLRRKYLSPRVINSLKYKRNLKQAFSLSEFEVEKGKYEEYGIDSNTEVYHLSKSVFDFLFIEEKGQLKLLTIEFDPN
ncbi:MAG TPA: hypothetical protein VFZ34_05600 [Blastocatellia bacterium]|nr:hypothetical protein [Blastocatellia bacterium]